ncbi:ExbD/TolR family protein [Caulobacter mirabilis]|uniref:Biopolymer transporter ExbD n=1 Tax=Caulobacter mirabilis TaxID=69666 RepID=A0A2D2AVI7_9CAUL|nr:biopolymer transporter ExbD [Caulobacter mirabilis]ATQ42032.1 hypothetical protein CSW64_06185 [Caulobacter mirabilis]
MPGKLFSRIDLTPMVGVLLALFAVTATVGWPPSEVEAFDLDHPGCNLPPAGVDHGARSKVLVVSANSDGSVSLNERRMPRAAFATELRHLAALERAPGIWVRADADVQYGAVFALYRQIESVGLAAEIGVINEEIG